MRAPVAGLIAKRPVAQPVFSFEAWRSMSERFFAHATYYASFVFDGSRAIACATSACSGATTM